MIIKVKPVEIVNCGCLRLKEIHHEDVPAHMRPITLSRGGNDDILAGADEENTEREPDHEQENVKL